MRRCRCAYKPRIVGQDSHDVGLPAPHLGSGGGQHRGRRHYPHDTFQQDRSGRQGRIAFHRRTYLDAIEKYCKSGEIESGALFRRIRRGQHITAERLSVVSARRIIKKWAKTAGIEGFISGHSLRVGTAVSLAQSGATLVDMQTAGRWDDPKMPAHYAKAELAERGAMARFFYGK